MDPHIDMPPPRWTPPQMPAVQAAQLYTATNSFPMPPTAAAAGANFAFDASFLPISPQSLLMPAPGEHDSSSEDSPMGQFNWMQGLDGLWDPKPDGMVEGIVPQYTQEQRPSMGMADYTSIDDLLNTGLDTGSSNQPEEARRNVRFEQPANTFQMEALIPRLARVEDVAPFSTFTRILHSYYAHL
jgi:hypothetical protein